MSNIAELIRLEGRVAQSRNEALLAELDTIKRETAELGGKIDALPRAIAEMLDGRDRNKA